MNFFKKRSLHKFQNMISASLLDGFSWTSVSWNINLSNLKTRTLSFHVLGQGEQFLEFASGEKDLLTFKNNSSRQHKILLDSQDRKELSPVINLKIHEIISTALDNFKQDVLSPVSGVTTLDFNQEQKYLEWLKTTFKVLNLALEKIHKEKHLVLTGSFFCGVEPQTKKKVLRLLAMNLDIFFYFQDDYSLRVVVFNDKNLGHGHSQEPSFHQIIKVTKPQFYDEIIKMVNKFAVVGEIE